LSQPEQRLQSTSPTSRFMDGKWSDQNTH
jgi:hypothetical protein